ncbi:MAG: hypothetical protein KC649_01670 [Candidatus Omnitrophica bacterium]|nr:hypothetical protein [Candidatus Omnitrophota bacterium]
MIQYNSGMEIILKLKNSGNDLKDLSLSDEEQLQLYRKNPGDTIVLRDRLYGITDITLASKTNQLIYTLDLISNPDWIVSKRGSIIHRNFNDGDRVKVFQASGPENARFVGECGVVLKEDTPNLPLEKRKVGEFHFTTIVKIRLDNGKEIAVPDTILKKIH